MAKKVRVVTKAVFNGQPVGSTLEFDEDFAKKYEAKKYLTIVGAVEKVESATKKPAAKTAAKSKSTKKTETK